MITLRCSSLPLFMKCAGSVRGDLKINEWNESSDLGTAVHDALARHIKGIPVDLPSVASLHGVDESELSILYYQGLKAWSVVHPIGQCETESERSLSARVSPGIELTGTADVISRSWARNDVWTDGDPGPMAVSITDWKSGRRDADYREQIMGYAALALMTYPQAAYAFGRIVWLRTDETEVYSLTQEGLVTWRERLIDKAAETEYRPGPHCQHCPRQHYCPAKQEMQRGAVELLGTGRFDLTQLGSIERLDLYHKAKSVASLAAMVIDELRAHVRSFGPIEADGTKLQIVQETRRALRPAKAWPVLQQFLTDDQLAECVTVSMTKVEDAAAKGQPRGEGAGRKRAMLAELNKAEAIGSTTIEKLTERRS